MREYFLAFIKDANVYRKSTKCKFIPIYKRAINLPSYHDMTHLEQDRVLSIFKNIKNLR